MDIVKQLRNHALPDPHDEREVMHAPLLKEAADEIEKLRSVMEQTVDAIEYLIDRSNDSDEMAYGTLSTTFVRDCLQDNLIALQEALNTKGETQ